MLESDNIAATPRQRTRWRLIWFFAGAGVNYLLIALPFKYFTSKYPELSKVAVSAISVTISATFFFCWNYFVGFRTDSRKRDAFARYLIAVVVLSLINIALLSIFKHTNMGIASRLHLDKLSGLDLDVLTAQACMGWAKFLVYHKWAFPVAKGGDEVGDGNRDSAES